MHKGWNDEELQTFQELVEDFEINEKDLLTEATFFEIAGFPSRENVFSNFLKFYFDTRNNHGFKADVLKALLLNIPEIKDEELTTVSIKREVVTDKLKRIDLVIETSKYVIAIENKVYHVLNNDLEEYSNYLKEHYTQAPLKIVLNLTDDAKENDHGFISISYKTFIDNLSKVVTVKDVNKYQIFFTEFVQNIKNHFPNYMTKEQIQFIVRNEDVINKIHELSNRSTNYINSRTSNIFKCIPQKYKEGRWWDYHEVSHSFEIQSEKLESPLKVACTVEISKIYLETFVESKLKLDLKEFLEKKYSVNLEINNNWIYTKEYSPLDETDNDNVATDIVQLLNFLEEFIDNN